MANGTYLRGEVYWVSLDDSVGSEIKTGRPAVVVSADGLNSKLNTVVVAFLTTGSYPAPTHPSVVSPEGVKRRVLCEQIRAIDKSRLVRHDSTLTEAELDRVTGALAAMLCIPLPQNADVQYKEEIAALKTEITVLQRCYDKAIDRIVDEKLKADILSRTTSTNEDAEYIEEYEDEPETEEQPKVEVEFEPEPELTDINHCTYDDLKRLGFSTNIVLTIISNRPYKSISDLRRLPGLTSIMYQLVERKICCTAVVEEEVEEPPVAEPVVEPPVVEKVNINTATPKELMEKLGISQTYAYTITGYRTKNGRYVDLEELLEVKGIPKVFLKNYRDRITIREDETPPAVEAEPEPEPEVSELANINTDSAMEIHRKTGMGMTGCYSITGARKKNGPFKSVEDLRNVNYITPGMFEKYRDKLTVGDSEPEPEAESEKLNLNTASLRDLMAIGFEKRAAALIVNERRKYGNYRSVDELAELPEISGRTLRKLRDKLEV